MGGNSQVKQFSHCSTAMVRISLDTDLEQSISSQPSTDASSESSESVEECSETGPLLPKGLDSSLINYDSTSIVAPVEAQSENDHFLDDEQLAAAKNVYAIISLLLIGMICPTLKLRLRLTSIIRCLHRECRWLFGASYLRHHLIRI